MQALKFDLEIPFWCAFGDFSSLNIKLCYPCPPATSLFGLIQNALGKFSLHCIDNSKVLKMMEKEYVNDFNNLNFSIIIKNSGELIEDYLNIHKGNRKDGYENDLKSELKSLIKNHPFEKELNKHLNKISKYSFFINLENNDEKESNDIGNEILGYDEDIIKFIKDYWNNPTISYNYNKSWLSTQINKQRLINPYFSVYVVSKDISGEFCLENLKSALISPKRPLYLGESDDIVNILNISIVEIKESHSSNISSVLPGIYQNSDLIKIPTNIKFDKSKESFTLCSIPHGDIGKSIECFECEGETFVFL